MGRFPSGQRGQTVNLLSTTSMVRIHLSPPFLNKDEGIRPLYRGVEQLAARRAHNPEVAGSSPASATRTKTIITQEKRNNGFFLFRVESVLLTSSAPERV